MTLAELLPTIGKDQKLRLCLIDSKTEDPIRFIFTGAKWKLEREREILNEYRRAEVFGTYTQSYAGEKGIIVFELKAGDPE